MQENSPKEEFPPGQIGSTPPRATKKEAKKRKLSRFLVDLEPHWQQPLALKRTKTYTLAKLVHHNFDLKRDWWVTFWAWDRVKGKKVRKRLNGEINHRSTVQGRMHEADMMIRQINAALKRGLMFGEIESKTVNFNTMTLTQLIDWVIEEKKSKKLSPEYFRKFKSINSNLLKWYDETNIAPLQCKAFTYEEAHNFFDWLRKEKKLGNKTINNYRNDLATVFNYAEKRRPGSFKQNPVFNLEQLPTYSRKHAAFSDDQLKTILDYSKQREFKDQFLLFIQCIYYLLARPKELRELKVKDIDIENNRVLFRAEISKNKRDEYVALAPSLKQILIKSKLIGIDAEHYIFGENYEPGPRPIGRHYYGKINAKVLKALNLNEKDYTIYGYKHSGAVALYRSTKDIKLVQRQCRHTSSTQTDVYLRDLGEMTNYNALENFKGAL